MTAEDLVYRVAQARGVTMLQVQWLTLELAERKQRLRELNKRRRQAETARAA